MGKNYSNQFVIRTLRLKKEPDNIMVKDAKENGLSVNTVYNQVIDRYVNSFRFIEKFPCLAIPCEMIKEFLNEVPEQKIITLGKMFGQYIPKHLLFLKEKDLNAQNLISLMKTAGQDNNWFQFNEKNYNGHPKIMLRHQNGLNWSIFLKNFYQTIFYEIFKTEIKIDICNNSLLILLPKNS
ncbi:MAG: hypothetical protein QCH99_03445 [Candidatus Bathyarchaeota archaeon]|nr:hypothetical protein [Candidatus Bathyarchaeum tardum]WGM88583.1 MAG: hypothetical protein NUK63_06565 [Candidatus Bathyarchaeum tardum]